MLLFEYGVLGALAGLVGSIGAVGADVGREPLSRWRFPGGWSAGEHAAGIVLTAILVAAVGVLSSLDVLRNKPLSTLRAE